MSNYIVLVKQVPDISQITDNAFDPKSGTLIRTRLENVINELDAQALAFANQMQKQQGDDDSKLVCLTMGPPMAEEVLRYGLARCADEAVLLTDRKLGGADTWATANPLAFGIRKIVKDIFEGDDDYYVVSGMQSVDGDTAQVPPQIAEELSIPCIAYVTDSELKKSGFEFTKIISGGSQRVAPKQVPAVLTVAKYEYPLYASFSRTRKANTMKVHSWTNDDINATHVGVKGSKTRVIRVYPPGKSTRKCQEVSDARTLAKIIRKQLKVQQEGEKGDGQMDNLYKLPSNRESIFERNFETTEKESEDYTLLTKKLKELDIKKVDEIDDYVKKSILNATDGKIHKRTLEDMIEGFKTTKPSYDGEVWVVAETDEETVDPSTFELTGKARELADSLETKVGVVIAGNDLSEFSDELIAAGADNVYMIEHELLEHFDPSAYRKAIADVIEEYSPQIALYAATPQGRMLAPMIAYSVGSGLTADCTGLDIRDSSRKREIAILLQTRPALGGNIMASIVTKDSQCQMATARPGVMKKLTPDPKRKGEVIKIQPQIDEDDLSVNILSKEKATGAVDFDSDVIISGGKGMQNRDNFDRMTSGVKEAISGKFDTSVEIGATRAAVEQGFAERIHQVGQTGTAVGPKLYMALGISGAIQHMIGISNAENIIAINSDPEAPIFKQCDYYIVDNVENVVPELVKALEDKD